MKVKNLTAALLCGASMVNCCGFTAFAKYEPPKEIWASFNKYAAALESNDYENIIKYGLIDLSILENEPSNRTVDEWICARYQHIANSYEHLGDYESSAEMYEKQIPYAEKLGWDDSAKIARAKAKNFKSDIMLFEKTNEPQSYFSAKNEQEQGVLYGVPGDSTYDQSQCSMELIYLEYGDRNFDWIRAELREANRRKMAVEFALNMPNQGYDIPYVVNGDEYLNLVADLLNDYPDIKYYVRFGAEFDIWENKADPEQFKAAFRKTADIIHYNVKNAAMVFSPNMVSSWDIDASDYYPGDEYVDWIGMSFYMMKYFRGVKDYSDDKKYLEVVFGTGPSSQPVLLAKDNIEKFAKNKPVMLSESGASHYIYTLNEQDTQWAKTRLEELYNYIPMVYPQVKLIAHFDQSIDGEVNDYSLKNNAEIKTLYEKLTKLPVFIQGSAENKVNVSYKKLTDTINAYSTRIELNTYVQVFGKDKFNVNYYIDGKWAASSNTIPYTKTLDLSPYSSGNHTLKVTAEADGSEVYSKTYNLVINKAENPGENVTEKTPENNRKQEQQVNNKQENENTQSGNAQTADVEIKVLVNGKEVAFDQKPVIIDSRTLVPLRAIFEALGASVDWDSSTSTVIARKNKDYVLFSIGNKTYYVNNEEKNLDVPARLMNDRTMVPIRAVSEALGANVEWEDKTKTVIINQ